MPNDKLYVGPRTRAAVIAVEKMVRDPDTRQSRRAVVPGSVSGCYYCLPTTLGAATGSWPTLTAATQTLDIYQDQAGTLVKIASSQIVQNWYPAAPAASKVAKVTPTGYGSWDLEAQSCT